MPIPTEEYGQSIASLLLKLKIITESEGKSNQTKSMLLPYQLVHFPDEP